MNIDCRHQPQQFDIGAVLATPPTVEGRSKAIHDIDGRHQPQQFDIGAVLATPSTVEGRSKAIHDIDGRHQPQQFDIGAVLATPPTVEGRSKAIHDIDGRHCLVRLIPSLTSFTYGRHELVAGTEVLRLDFFDMAVQKLRQAGIRTAFVRRVAADMYIAEYCRGMPFEVIVKNVAGGSTLVKYPGLFPAGHRFRRPVVKFDFRVDPEDQPISEDYVREAGFDANALKNVALRVNAVLRAWLRPCDLLDFCLIFGLDAAGRYSIISEISPDAMRLRSPEGRPLDKDLFRQGAPGVEILSAWRELAEGLRA